MPNTDEVDPRIVERLKKFREIFEAVKKLESRGVSDSLGLELANTTTRVQNAISFLKRGQDSLDTSNALELADEEIERAWTEVRYIARLRDEGGRDARYK